jgi:hypothetical protein
LNLKVSLKYHVLDGETQKLHTKFQENISHCF